jgi:DNA processing protein
MNALPADERRARAALSRLAEPADGRLGKLVAERGASAVLGDVQRGHLGADHGELLASLRARLPRLDVDRDLAALDAVSGRLVCPGDEEWPEALDDLGAVAPLLLWVRGSAHLASATDSAIAIVGARNATEYGELVAGDIAATVAEQGWAIVSGGAFGIDAAGHRGAMAAGGITIAVLACGIDMAYPQAHHALFEQIAVDGAVVSELPPGSAPHRLRFLTRNRLIAGLAAGTVIVEAAVRSGAKRTATYTRELGRPLMVVPGPVTSEQSTGCHQLLRDDPLTVLVTNAAEVLEMVGRIGDDLAPVLRGEVLPRDELSPESQRVLDALPVLRAQGPARIADTAGLPLTVVEGALGVLLLGGLAEQRDSGWRLSRATRAAPTASPNGPITGDQANRTASRRPVVLDP